MKITKNILLILFLSLPFAFWGWAYELSYFKTLGLNVFDTFNYVHFAFSGGIWLLILLVGLILANSLMKFFSKDIETNDWEAVKESLNKTQFSDVIGLARGGFILSVVYLAIIIYVPSGYWFINALGQAHLFIAWQIFLLFFASLWLSPQHSKSIVIVIFMLAIGACFAAGGIANARANFKAQQPVVRDDYLVTINKTTDGKYVAKPKPIELPMPLWLRKVLGS